MRQPVVRLHQKMVVALILAFGLIAFGNNSYAQPVVNPKYATSVPSNITSGNAAAVAVWVPANPANSRMYIVDRGLSFVEIHNPITNTYLGRFGGKGAAAGRLDFPIELAIARNVPTNNGTKDVLFVSERNNGRVSMFSLPDTTFLGHVGSGNLIQPRGIAVHWNQNQLQLFVAETNPQTDEIRVFNVNAGGAGLTGSLNRSFQVGGVLDNFALDSFAQRLYLCDEDSNNVMVYDLNGTFIRRFGQGQFVDNPEGIDIYDAGAGRGYIIVTDKDGSPTEFELFDRQTFSHYGNFVGTSTSTLGLDLVQRPMPPTFTGSSLFVTDNDKRVHAYDWNQVVTAMALNREPVVAPINNQVMNEATVLGVSATATDPDGHNLTLSVSNLPAFGNFIDFGNGSGLISLAAQYDHAGVYPNIHVIATDNGSPALADTATFTLTVNNVNRPPDLTTIGNKTAPEGVTTNFTITANDPDGDPVVLTATGLPPFATFTDNNNSTATLSVSPGFDDLGTYPNVKVFATDNFSPPAFDTETFSIIVTNTNRPPVINAIAAQQVAENSEIAVPISASDPDGNKISFSLLDPSASGMISDNGDGTGTLTFRPNFDQAGVYPNVQVIAIDDGVPSLTDTTSLQLTITNVNRAPAMNPISDQVVDEGASLNVPVSGSDADGDAIKLTAINVPPFGTFNDNGAGSGQFTFIPGYLRAGVYDSVGVIIEEVNSAGNARSKSGQFGIAAVFADTAFFKLTVNNVNRPPVVTPIPNQTVMQDSTLEVPVAASDPDSDQLTLSTSNSPAFGQVIDNGDGTGTLRFTPTITDVGTHNNIQMRATDNSVPNLTGFTTFSLTVTKTVPAGPDSLIAIATNDVTILLRWQDKSNNEDGFKIERHAGDGVFVTIATINTADTMSHLDTGLTPNTTYTYRMLAFNSEGNSLYSSATSESTPASEGSDPSINLALNKPIIASSSHVDYPPDRSNDGDNDSYWRSQPIDPSKTTQVLQVDLQSAQLLGRLRILWRGDHYATKFRLKVSVDGENWTGAVPRTDGAGGVQEVLFPEQVWARHARLFLLENNNVTYRIQELELYSGVIPTAPAAPSELTAFASDQSQIVLKWQDNSDNENGFKIERKTGEQPFAEIATTTANTIGFSNTGLTANTVYTYRVRAFNDIGNSEYSSEVTVTTPDPNGAEPSVNLAKGKPAIASTEHKAYPASNAVDDSVDTFWRSQNIDSNATQWFNVDLQSTQLVGRIKVLWRGDNFATTFKLKGSLDGVSWFNFGSAAGTAGMQEFIFKQKAFARYVRLLLTANNTATYRISELQVFSGEENKPPKGPSKLTAIATGLTRIVLSWQDNSDKETGFKIERKTGEGTFSEIATWPANLSAFTDSNLTQNTVFAYRVRAFNPYGNSPYSNEVITATPDPNGADPSVNLAKNKPAWASSTNKNNPPDQAVDENEASFWRSLNVDSNGVQWFNVDLQSTQLVGRAQVLWRGENFSKKFKIKGSLDGTNWFNFVSAEGAAGMQEFLFKQKSLARFIRLLMTENNTSTYRITEFQVFSGEEIRPPQAPAELSATATNTTSMLLKWLDQSDNESGFKIERKTGANPFAEVATIGLNLTSFSDNGLLPNTAYVYRMRAFNDDGHSTYSNEASGATPNPSGADPAVNLAKNKPVSASSSHQQYPPDRAVDEMNDSFWRSQNVDTSKTQWLNVDLQSTQLVGRIKILWQGDHFAKKFKIKGSFDGMNWFNFASANGTPGMQELLFEQKQFARYVRLLMTENNTSTYRVAELQVFSGEQSKPPAAPTQLAAVATSLTTIALSWKDNATDEQGFKIERKTGTATFAEIATVAANTSSFSNIGLAQNTAFTYRVRAFNGKGNSAYSAEVTEATPNPNGADPTVNLALNKAISASSSNGSLPPQNAVDGNVATHWRSLLADSSKTEWLLIDLGSTQLLGRARVKWEGQAFAKEFRMKVSTDNVNWITAFSWTAGTVGTQEIVFPAKILARYVRLFLTKPNNTTYKVQELELYSGPVGLSKPIAKIETATPERFGLEQNYPNPFNPTTIIRYAVSQASEVRVVVYNLAGQKIKTLATGMHQPGVYEVHFDGTGLASGTYFAIMKANGERHIRRMLLAK